MSPKFNIDRPKISDEEINQHKNFDHLVEQFKQQSLKQARGDESWWKNKKIRYSTIIAGFTVICTVTYFSLFNNQAKQKTKHETLTTQNNKNISASNPTIAVASQHTGPRRGATLNNSGPVRSKAFIQPPSQKLKASYTAYKISNDKGGNIIHSTASKIKIPKNSFVDKNGNDVVGDVTIEYKEFHDLGDVIASGIPMAYDSAGTKYNLETAGMFDIRGYKNGEPVFIKQDKKLEIELASRNSENKFNQYYLDTLKKNWCYIKKDKTYGFAVPKKNTDRGDEGTLMPEDPKLLALKKEIDVIIPKKIDSVKVVYTNKVQKLPRPKEPAKPVKSTGKPVFQLEASPVDFPELAAFSNLLFEVGPENKNYSKELNEITWSDVKISQGPAKGKNYLLTLMYRSRVEKLVVYPVLKGVDYEKAKDIYDERLVTYQDLLDKKQAEEKRLIAEMEAKQAAYVAEQKKKQEDYKAEQIRLQVRYELEQQNALAADFNSMASNQVRATRIFNVSKFGIYNSDCPHAMPQGVTVSPVFVMDKGNGISPEFVYLVDHTLKTVYCLGIQDGFKLRYDPLNNYSICIFAGTRLFLCNKELFKQTSDNAGNRFTVTPLPDAADNLAAFKKALEI